MSKYNPGIFVKKLNESLFQRRKRYNRPRFGRSISQTTLFVFSATSPSKVCLREYPRKYVIKNNCLCLTSTIDVAINLSPLSQKCMFCFYILHKEKSMNLCCCCIWGGGGESYNLGKMSMSSSYKNNYLEYKRHLGFQHLTHGRKVNVPWHIARL
jgi:hypothetical protein